MAKRKWGQQIVYSKTHVEAKAGTSWWATPEVQRDPVAFSKAWAEEVPRMVQSSTWTPNGHRTLDSYTGGIKK